MASSFRSSSPCLYLFASALFIFFSFALPSLAAYGGGERMVGGRTEVRDAESNKEVQDLGRFSVEEYNHRLRRDDDDDDGRLAFARVVQAQRQVVSGVKYYLRVLASKDGGSTGRQPQQQTFDAVVAVKPWLGSRELLSFVAASQQ